MILRGRKHAGIRTVLVALSLVIATACSPALAPDMADGGQVGKPADAGPMDYEHSPFGFCQGGLTNQFSPDFADYDPSYSNLNDLGVFWDRPFEGHVTAVWDEIERTTKGVYDFQAPDKALLEIYEQTPDMNLLVSLPIFSRLYGSPTTADGLPDVPPPGATTGRPMYPTHPDALTGYKAYVKTVVARYPQVKYWMVGQNEFDDPAGNVFFGNSDDSKIALMAEYTMAACDALSEVCRDCRPVLAGAVIATPSFFKRGDQFPLPDETTGQATDDGVYYKLLGLLENHCDSLIVDYHFWPFPNYRDYRHQATVIQQIKALRPGADIWTTESGSVSDLDGFTEADQASNLLRTYVFALVHGQKKIFWTNVLEYHWSDDPNEVFNHMGLIHNPTNADGLSHKKLSYYTFKKMVETLEGTDWLGARIIEERDGVYVYAMTKGGRPIWVLWNDNQETRNVAVILDGVSRARVTNLTPPFSSGVDVADYAKAFTVKIVEVNSDKKITLAVGREPLVIERQVE